MIFHKESKICFSLIPRTGSTSLRHLLLNLKMRQVFMKDPFSMAHGKYKDAVKDYPSLSQYTIYGVFRNPAQRLVSTLNLNPPTGINLPNQIKQVFISKPVKDQSVLVDEVRSGLVNNPENILYQPQYKWFEGIANPKVIDFDNLQAGLDAALAGLEGDKTIPHLHQSKVKHVHLTPELEAFAREYYAVDYQFAKDVLGKEY